MLVPTYYGTYPTCNDDDDDDDDDEDDDNE